MTKIEEAVQAYKKAKQEAFEAIKTGLDSALKEKMRSYKYLRRYSWCQYTPAFNDGDPCTFTSTLPGSCWVEYNGQIYESELHDEIGPINLLMSCFRYKIDWDKVREDNFDMREAYGSRKYWVNKQGEHPPENLFKDLIEADKEFDDICDLVTLSEDFLEEIFGDDVSVSVVKEEDGEVSVVIEDYCGY